MMNIINICFIYVLLTIISPCCLAGHITDINHYPDITTKDCGISKRWPQIEQDGFKNQNMILTRKLLLYGGREVETGDVPWAVYIQHHIKLTTGWKYSSCTGIILNEWWILTVTHCVICKDCYLSTLYIYPGIIDKDNLGSSYGSQMVIKNKNYEQSPSAEYDIALVKLDRPMDLKTDGLMNSICLPKSKQVNLDYEYAFVAGYGYVGEDYNNKLRMGYQRISPTIPPFYLLIKSKQFPDAHGTLICMGDSGGPMWQVVDGRAVLIGITVAISRPVPPYSMCPLMPATINYHLRVSYMIDWITDQFETINEALNLSYSRMLQQQLFDSFV